MIETEIFDLLVSKMFAIGIITFIFLLVLLVELNRPNHNLVVIIERAYFPFIFISSVITLIPNEINRSFYQRILVFIGILVINVGLYLLLKDAHAKYLRNKTANRKALVHNYLILLLLLFYIWMSNTFFYILDTKYERYKHYSILIFVACIIALNIGNYYLFKTIFFPSKSFSIWVEYSLILISGLIIGRITNVPTYYVKELYLLGENFVLFYIYDLVIMLFYAILFVLSSLIPLIYTLNSYFKILEASKLRPKRIDPITIPRLKLSILYPIFWLALNAMLLGALFFGKYLNETQQILVFVTIMFVFIVSVLIEYFAFQTPEFIKKKWRE